MIALVRRGVTEVRRYYGNEIAANALVLVGQQPAPDPNKIEGNIRWRSGGVASQIAIPDTGAQIANVMEWSFRRERRTGMSVLLMGLVVFGGWASFVPLSGAIVATGTLVSASNVKKIQHTTGGIVAQVNVKDGMRVKADELLVRLDDTQTRSNMQMIVTQFEQIRVRIARLTAERDGRDSLIFPPLTSMGAADADKGKLLESELSQFKARALSRRSQKEVIQSHITQLGKQIGGLEAQLESNARQTELIQEEIKRVYRMNVSIVHTSHLPLCLIHRKQQTPRS